jgi:hypothetical protein
MVYRDHWALSQWYMHYASLLGAENLFILAHGVDDKITEICPNAHVITIPRDDLNQFDQSREKILNDFQTSLNEDYEWVIRTDADELICLDPALYPTFEALLSQRWGPALFALGLEVAQQPNDEPIDTKTPALSKRSAAIFTGHYSKAWAVKGTARLSRHGIEVGKRRGNRVNFALPKGVYLVHLKYADLTALELANQHRIEVANSKGQAMPGTAWREPQKTSQKFFEKFTSFPCLLWENARDQAYAEVSKDPVRELNTGLVRARSVRFENTTQLPSWFKTLN